MMETFTRMFAGVEVEIAISISIISCIVLCIGHFRELPRLSMYFLLSEVLAVIYSVFFLDLKAFVYTCIVLHGGLFLFGIITWAKDRIEVEIEMQQYGKIRAKIKGQED